MANQTLKARLQQRNDTAANWTTSNPVLMKGEIGVESDTLKQKIGDGVSTWTALPYATVVPSQLTGMGDMLKSAFATADPANGYVDKAKKADVLSTPRAISLTGDVTATGNFDGSAPLSLAAVLANVITAGSGSVITVNAKGLVTAIRALVATDIPNLTLSKITDAGTAASKNVGTAAGNVVVVETNGFINPSVLPPLAIIDVFEVTTIAAMLALTAEKGDIAIVNLSTGAEVYMLGGTGDPTVQANWKRLNIPTGAVVSVNSQTGAVTLTTTNIPEGTNLYYTDARATTNFNTNFALKASTGLSDGASILHNTDTLILNGGNAALT